MNCKFKKIIISANIVLLTFPKVIFAAGVNDLIDETFALVTEILIPLAFALCLFYFFWGVVKYIRTGAGSEEAAKEGKKVMIWGIVGLFVAFAIWGIISFIQNELGIPNIDRVERPPVQDVNVSIY